MNFQDKINKLIIKILKEYGEHLRGEERNDVPPEWLKDFDKEGLDQLDKMCRDNVMDEHYSGEVLNFDFIIVKALAEYLKKDSQKPSIKSAVLLTDPEEKRKAELRFLRALRDHNNKELGIDENGYVIEKEPSQGQINESKLKPCPHCGAAPKIGRQKINHSSGMGYIVQCLDCFYCLGIFYDKTELEVVEFWNNSPYIKKERLKSTVKCFAFTDSNKRLDK